MSAIAIGERRVVVPQPERPLLGAPPEELVEERVPAALPQTGIQKVMAFATAFFKTLVEAFRLLINSLFAWKSTITAQRPAVREGIPHHGR